MAHKEKNEPIKMKKRSQRAPWSFYPLDKPEELEKMMKGIEL